MKRTLLTLALIASAGAAHAQMTAEPVDPYGRPLIGRNDWVRQPGDSINAGVNVNTGANVAVAPYAVTPSAPRTATFKDEFGFRYDAQGNRLDARGNIISPQTR
jgi:hypothetical protein